MPKNAVNYGGQIPIQGDDFQSATIACTAGMDGIDAVLGNMNGSLTALSNNKQNKTDNGLATTDKTIVGAINEVMGSISQKAPISSPTFTGNPQAPTPAFGDNDTSIATTEFVQKAIDNYLVGAILYTTSNVIPIGFLKCNGSAVSRTTYARLFAKIGTTFGAGDGSTTFNVPDLRGLFIRGLDEGRGLDSGRVLGSYQADTLQNITGTFPAIRNAAGGSNIAYSGAFGGQSNYSRELVNTETGYGAENFDASRVARTSDETRPKNIAFIPIIKY